MYESICEKAKESARKELGKSLAYLENNNIKKFVDSIDNVKLIGEAMISAKCPSKETSVSIGPNFAKYEKKVKKYC